MPSFRQHRCKADLYLTILWKLILSDEPEEGMHAFQHLLNPCRSIQVWQVYFPLTLVLIPATHQSDSEKLAKTAKSKKQHQRNSLKQKSSRHSRM